MTDLIADDDPENTDPCECGSGELTNPDGGCCKYCFDEFEEDGDNA